MEKMPLENLTFPASYFEDEVREGFYISSMMKRYWACQLKVLSAIEEVCQRHGIRWFAEYGTLIGAVRHGGYIPWDDDLDICMMRDDWNRFFEVAGKELPVGFRALTIENTPGYEEVIGRVVGSDKIDYSQEHLEEFYGCPYTVGVDIFPLDGIYNDHDREKDRNVRAKKVLEKISVASGKEKHQLLKQIEKIYSECDAKDSKNLALMPFYVNEGHHIFPKELYKDCVKYPFENTYVYVNGRCEELLELEYGDYLSINKKGGLHQYPVYADQEEILKDAIGHNPYRYTVDYNELLQSVQRYVLRMTKSMQQGAALGNKNVTGANDNATESPGTIPGTGTRKQVVFLPCKAKWWKTMEPLWEAYSQNDSYEVHVLPIFYYDSDYNGNVGERHDERDLFPEYLQVEACEKYDFEGIHPDVIVTQVPYDGYSTTMTVHEFFYSSNMQKCTDELIYLPCMDMDAPLEKGDKSSQAIAVFIENQAVINSDKVVVGSEALRDFYVDTLVDLTGADTKAYWTQKVVSQKDEIIRITGRQDDDGADKASAESDRLYDGETSIESHASTRSDNVQDIATYDAAWNNFLGDSFGRKIVIYHVSISFLLRDPQKSPEKIKRSLQVFAEAKDKVTAIFVPQKQILTELQNINPALWQEYLKLVEEIRNSPNCIYDEEGFCLDYIDKWNGYYGDADPLVRKCVLKRIPVMIENIDI